MFIDLIIEVVQQRDRDSALFSSLLPTHSVRAAHTHSMCIEQSAYGDISNYISDKREKIQKQKPCTLHTYSTHSTLILNTDTRRIFHAVVFALSI